MARLRVALAGAGMVSRHHLLAWQKLDTAEVVAIADPDHERATARATEFGIPQTFAAVPAMLDAVRPAALDIAAPMALHAALVRAAADRGIDVMCQKPLAPTLAEAQALAADARGRIRLMVHENWRFRPHYREIARWLREERIGRRHAFRLEVLGSGVLPESPAAIPHGLQRQPFLAGMERLLVLELLVHHLDLLRCLLGPLELVHARLARISPAVRGEDTGVILLQADGAIGSIFASMAAYGRGRGGDELEILGERGRISFRDGTARLLAAAPETFTVPDDAYQQSYDATIAHFVAALRSGAPFETPPEVHLAALALVEGIYAAAAAAQPMM